MPAPGVDDPEYSETELPGDYYPCVFPPGDYHMDGSQALCYARVRRSSNDLDRISRQQIVILAMMKKAAELQLPPLTGCAGQPVEEVQGHGQDRRE